MEHAELNSETVDHIVNKEIKYLINFKFLKIKQNINPLPIHLSVVKISDSIFPKMFDWQ